MNPSVPFMIELSGSVKFLWALGEGWSSILGGVPLTLCPLSWAASSLRLRFGLQRRLGLPDLVQAGHATGQFLRQFVPALVLAVLPVLSLVGLLGILKSG